MGCDFNPCWFWTKTDVLNVLKLIKYCEHPIVHVCSGCSIIGDYRIDRSYIKEEDISPLTKKMGLMVVMNKLCGKKWDGLDWIN